MPEAERGYLLDPLAGYPVGSSAELRDRIAAAHRALIEEADAAAVEAARELSRELAEGDPDFPPAKVLAAEADFVLGDRQGILPSLLPISDALSTYAACQLLVGRTAELSGDLPLAYAAYRAVAARSPLALRRTGELHPRALEIVGNRLREALRVGGLDEAGRQLALLVAWAPTDTATFEASRAVASARGDHKAELAALHGLAERRPPDQDLLLRRSDLELEVGDPTAGLKIIQDLADRAPRDALLAGRLASAKFRWRLSLLPQKVREVAARSELSRADFAVLLYWLVPEVRYGRPSEGRIATDILDHPQREEIVRVVNLGLMEVDESLHHFSPGSPVRRAPAVRSLVRILSRFAGASPCLGPGATGPQPSQRTACEAAERCGLVPNVEECQAGEPFSGDEAVELVRRALSVLGRS